MVDRSAPKERYVTFSARDQVVLVAELAEGADVVIQAEGTVEVVLRGRLLAADDVASETARGKLWGVLTPYAPRAPAFPDPLAARRVCACGCNTGIPRSAQFAPGHDKRAIHDRISRRWGSLVEFIRWFDASESRDGDASAELEA